VTGRTLLPIAALALLAVLTACGKAGAPQMPGSAFPHQYPDPKLAPTAPVRPVPEDQPGLETGEKKAKFTSQGSYIDPAVRDTELSRGAVMPGSTLPYAQTRSSDGSNTPFNQGLGTPNASPLPAVPGTVPTAEPDQP
jgi:hypothetical protein